MRQGTISNVGFEVVYRQLIEQTRVMELMKPWCSIKSVISVEFAFVIENQRMAYSPEQAEYAARNLINTFGKNENLTLSQVGNLILSSCLFHL